MADTEQGDLSREQVISLISKHAKELASLARNQGCETLYYLLQTAAEQAEKELGSHSGGEGGTKATGST
jgi:hypothetical protein